MAKKKTKTNRAPREPEPEKVRVILVNTPMTPMRIQARAEAMEAILKILKD